MNQLVSTTESFTLTHCSGYEGRLLLSFSRQIGSDDVKWKKSLAYWAEHRNAHVLEDSFSYSSFFSRMYYS